MREQIALQKILRKRLEEARIKNASYSIRALAKRAGMSPATLSLILNGRRRASQKLADRVSKKLMLDPQERSELLDKFPARSNTDTFHLQLTSDQYQVIADWQCFAILNLIEIPGFEKDPHWIAKRLGVPVSNVVQNLNRLKRLGMIKETVNGLQRVASRYRTTDDVKNLSLQKTHYQTLELAQKSLLEDPVEDRDFTWVTFPLDKSKIQKAKTLIRRFQDDLTALLNEESRPDEVYRLAVQLFPLTRSPQGQENKK